MAERISEGEQQVMEVLWADAPLTAAEVAQRIPPARGWSERTVKTMLARLLAKGALVHEEDGRRYLYRPAVARTAYAVGETRKLADRLFGGRVTPLVAHLAEGGGISPDDVAELEALLKKLKP
jgi:BlaI family transcriptional regulator, penicillinase repressor